MRRFVPPSCPYRHCPHHSYNRHHRYVAVLVCDGVDLRVEGRRHEIVAYVRLRGATEVRLPNFEYEGQIEWFRAGMPEGIPLVTRPVAS